MMNATLDTTTGMPNNAVMTGADSVGCKGGTCTLSNLHVLKPTDF